jgi:catechol 2,3-dioxygenase-like lactoylglutathione lyase family enzyme
MAATIDHVAVPSRDPERAAGALAGILGAAVGPEGPDGDMFSVGLDGCRVLFAAAAGTVAPHHLAFRVDGDRFAGVVERLGAEGLAYGNDPEHPDNERTDDPRGGPGRVYFVSPDGHLFEVTVRS